MKPSEAIRDAEGRLFCPAADCRGELSQPFRKGNSMVCRHLGRKPDGTLCTYGQGEGDPIDADAERPEPRRLADPSPDRVTSILARLRNHPVIAWLIVLGVVIAGLAAFAESLQKLFSSLKGLLGG